MIKFYIFSIIVILLTTMFFIFANKISPLFKGFYKLKILIPFIFSLLLLTGMIGTFIATKKVSEAENRNLMAWVDLKEYNISKWPTLIEKYVNDHFGLRDEFLSFFRFIEFDFFQKSLSKNVIVGNDGWLFSKKAVKSAYLNNQLGIKELRNSGIIKKIVQLESTLSQKDIKLLIVIFPSKPYIYSEKLPKWVSSNGNYRESIESFKFLIKEYTNVPLIDLHDKLKNTAENADETFYYKSDTHWNPNGAFVAAEELFNFINNSSIGITINHNLTSYSKRQFAFRGDLYRSSNLDKIEEGVGYLPSVPYNTEVSTFSENERDKLGFTKKIDNWKKLSIRTSLVGTDLNPNINPIIIADSYLLSSSGNIIHKMFGKSYTMQYQEMNYALPLVLDKVNDSKLLILSFVDRKFKDGEYNSFFENFMKWNIQNNKTYDNIHFNND